MTQSSEALYADPNVTSDATVPVLEKLHGEEKLEQPGLVSNVVSLGSLSVIQQAVNELQRANSEVQKISIAETNTERRQKLLDVQIAATNVMRSALALESEALAVLARQSGEVVGDEATYCSAGFELLSAGRIVEAPRYFEQALHLNPDCAPAHKGLGDTYLQSGEPERAISSYSEALRCRPEYPEVDNNLALAYLATYRHVEAQSTFRRILFRDHGLANEQIRRFNPSTQPVDGAPCYASPFKLVDRIDQLTYLLKRGKIDSSFEKLVEAYRALLEELRRDKNRIPYSPLSADQLRPFNGYYDKIIYYRDAPRLAGAAVNPKLDFRALEEEYSRSRTIYFDDFLTQEALLGLRTFFLESTVFFRHSEAGFVGSYVTDGFSCNLVFQIIDELQKNFPRLLSGRPLNNMWCYRYGSQGPGVRPHNGDGSVTINFYLTQDDANIGSREGGGMVMYDKEHPPYWDWLTFNLKKDDPAIQAQIAEYLADANALVVPYRCNRAVLFHSTLFHKTDPFHFRDEYESRRMNITMLFGRRGQESAVLR